MIRFCRDPDEPDVKVVDMQATAQEPYCRLSFDYQHGQIPVLCMPRMYAESVTGIMEALKLVGKQGRRGHVNVGYLVGAGRQRKVEPGEWVTGYHYKGRAIDTAEARRRILIPQYLWVLNHRVGDVLAKLRRDAQLRSLGLYDGHSSADLEGSDRLSAAALLAAFLNDRLEDFQQGHRCLDH